LSERKKTDHPDLFQLAAYAEDSLDEAARSEVGRHVAGCALCDLALKELARFETIEGDEELIGDAAWKSARFQMTARHRAATARKGNGLPNSREKKFLWRWMVPLAAAAALAVLFMPDFLWSPGSYTDRSSPLRGEEEAAAEILPVAPLGELAGPPEFFTWTPDKSFDFYTLRIFTRDLEPVYEETGITARKRAVTDTLLASLRPGTIYLWSVTGHTGLQQEAASPTARFTISENPPQR
jgi:hypothetical protein